MGQGRGEGTRKDVEMVSLHRRVGNKLDDCLIIGRIVIYFCFNLISVTIFVFDPYPSTVGAQIRFLYILFADDGMPQ